MRSFSLPTCMCYWKVSCIVYTLHRLSWIKHVPSCVICSFLLLKRDSVSLNSKYYILSFSLCTVFIDCFFDEHAHAFLYKRARQKCSKSFINYLQSVHLKVICIYGEEAIRTDIVRHKRTTTAWYDWNEQ